MSATIVIQPKVQEAFALYSQALEHLDKTLTETICDESNLVFGDLASEISFAASGENFFVEVKAQDGQVLMLDDPKSPLVLSCALYFSLLGDGAYTVDVRTRTRTTFQG